MPTPGTSARSRLRTNVVSAFRCRPDVARMKGSGVWHAQHAWVGHVATDVLIEAVDGRITAVTEDVPAPPGAIELDGYTFPGLANIHSHAFQESLRGRTESGGGDFRRRRRMMFDAAQGSDRKTYTG